ncbi:hypothetical protein HJC23_010291 [Cyclotella cryptica]|uniref:Uncharacterized protein n=1 Tax=Cyclotella cryptica TaxID=29204 RepID=A0ABD3QP40_9STRA
MTDFVAVFLACMNNPSEIITPTQCCQSPKQSHIQNDSIVTSCVARVLSHHHSKISATGLVEVLSAELAVIDLLWGLFTKRRGWTQKEE